MSSEKLMNAIGLLDDELILDAEKKPEKKSYAIYIKYTAVAASLLLLVLAAFLMRNAFNEPGGEPENTLLAESESIKVPYTAEPQITKEPVLPTEIITTETPVSEEMVVDRDTNKSFVEVVYGDVKTPEPIVTELPVTTSKPIESTKEPVDEKPSKDNSSLDEDNNSDITDEENSLPAVPPVTAPPVTTEAPDEDTTWTEQFVVTNVEHSYGIDKSESIYFVEQLYFSSMGDAPGTDNEKQEEWTYSVTFDGVLYTQAEVAVLDRYIEGKEYDALLEGVNQKDGTVKETKAYIYKVSGIAKEAAVAVQIEEQTGYYLFINRDYKAGSLQEFVEAYDLQEQAKLKALAVYDDWDKTITEDIDSKLIWDILLSGEGKPVDYKTLYYVYDVAGSIEMDVKMYGCLDVPIALYDEGYVAIYLGDINGAFYVGTERVAQIKELIEITE